MCLCVLIHCSAAITITINITVDNVLLFLRSGTYIGMYCIAIVFIMRYVTEVLNTHKLESDKIHSSIVGRRPLSPAYAPVHNVPAWGHSKITNLAGTLPNEYLKPI